MDNVVTTIIIFVVLILLVLPVYGLSSISTAVPADKATALCMVTLVVATFLFSVLLLCFTKAKRHEVLATSAG